MKKLLAVALGVALLSGCATIFEGGTQPVTFNSTPDGAKLTVTNRAGEKIHAGTTPATLTLQRGAGFFKSEQYTVQIVKEGYAAKELVVTGAVNGWYVGNILFGGLIGILIIDPATGAMYDLAPDKVHASLDALPTQTSGQGLTIVMAEDVPTEMWQHARPLQ